MGKDKYQKIPLNQLESNVGLKEPLWSKNQGFSLHEYCNGGKYFVEVYQWQVEMVGTSYSYKILVEKLEKKHWKHIGTSKDHTFGNSSKQLPF